MIVPTRSLIAASLIEGIIVCFAGCVGIQPTRSVSSGSAAFASYHEPWQKDLVRSAGPVYPGEDRRSRRQGCGVFHLTLDLTDSVVQVTVRKSTGYATLDAAAVQALKQCVLKPGSWKTLYIPIEFRWERLTTITLSRCVERNNRSDNCKSSNQTLQPTAGRSDV